MKIIPHLIYSTGLVLSVYLGCQTYIEARTAHEHAETIRAAYYQSTAQWNATTARFKAITAAAELESKRTEVETSIRKVVMAEYRKCRKVGCK